MHHSDLESRASHSRYPDNQSRVSGSPDAVPHSAHKCGSYRRTGNNPSCSHYRSPKCGTRNNTAAYHHYYHTSCCRTRKVKPTWESPQKPICKMSQAATTEEDPWERLQQYLKELEKPVPVNPKPEEDPPQPALARPIPLRVVCEGFSSSTSTTGRVRFQIAMSDIKELIPHRIRPRGLHTTRPPYIRGNFCFSGFCRMSPHREIFLTYMGLFRSPQSARDHQVSSFQRFLKREQKWVLEIPVLGGGRSCCCTHMAVRVSHPRIKSFVIARAEFISD